MPASYTFTWCSMHHVMPLGFPYRRLRPARRTGFVGKTALQQSVMACPARMRAFYNRFFHWGQGWSGHNAQEQLPYLRC